MVVSFDGSDSQPKVIQTQVRHVGSVDPKTIRIRSVIVVFSLSDLDTP